MKVPAAAPVLVAALGAEVALAAPVVADDLLNGVADVNLMEPVDIVPEISQGPSLNGKSVTHVPIPVSVDIGTVTTTGVEARDEDETPCIAEANCAGISPPKVTTATIIPATPLPTSTPTYTHSSTIIPVGVTHTLVTGPFPNYPLTESAYCWQADNGQVHCAWTAVEPESNPNTKHARRTVQTAAPEPVAGSLLEREVGAVPTTLATVGVKVRAEEGVERETQFAKDAA